MIVNCARKYKKRRGCVSATPSLSVNLYAGDSPVEQPLHKVLRGLPPGRLHKHDELNRSDGRSDHGADAAQLKVTSPGDRLVHPVQMTVHKSNLLSNNGSSIKAGEKSAEID